MEGGDGFLTYRTHGGGELVLCDECATRHENSTLDDVVELAQIARPSVRCQHLGSSCIEAFNMARELFVGKAYEEVGEEIEVGATLGELRHVYGELAETMVEVFTETSFGYCLLQILVGCSHKTYVNGTLLGSTQRTYATLL